MPEKTHFLVGSLWAVPRVVAVAVYQSEHTVGKPTSHCGFMVSDEFLFFTYFLVQFCFFGMTCLKNTLFFTRPHDASVHVLQT